MTTTAMSFEAEVQACLEGDTDAFARIVEAHESTVRAITFSVTGDSALSDDLAQETFLTAWQRLSRLRDPKLLSGWLYGIARNLSRNALRRRKRDPLHCAGDLDRIAVGTRYDRAPDATDTEREAVAWQALRELPQAYREALVFHYREGMPITSIARTLNVSEECVRQRLTRGRRMLRDSVAAMIEETLGKTRVEVSLVPAVLVALPALAAPASLTAGVATGTATIKGAGAVAGSGISAAIIAVIAGPVLGMTGGFFGMWRSIQNAQTLRIRRYSVKMCAVTYALVWLMIGYEAACGHLLWSNPAVMALACAAGWVLYAPLLILLIVRWNIRMRALHEEDLLLRQASEVPVELSDLSLTRVWLCFAWCMAVAVAGSGWIVVWLGSLPHVSIGAVALFVALSHLGFFVLYVRGVTLAQDDVAFAESAPLPRVEPAHAVPAQYSERARFWNNTAALAGSVLGGTAWLCAALVAIGRPMTGAFLGVIALAVVGTGMWRFRVMPLKAHRTSATALLIMGVIDGTLIWLNPAVANLASPGGPGSVPDWLSTFGALAMFGVHAAIGIAIYYLGERSARVKEAADSPRPFVGR